MAKKNFPLSLPSVLNPPAKAPASKISQTTIPVSHRPDPFAKGLSQVAHPISSSAIQAKAHAHDANSLVSDAVRKQMTSRLRQQGIHDPRILTAMQKIPRHYFVEPALASQAYIDAPLPIGHHQTISQPYIVARMIEAMSVANKFDKVLEIGTGCGYQAAVLSVLYKEVYSIERIKALHVLAKNNLRPLRIPNIRLQYGDGLLGLPELAPFDAIIVAAAGLEIPQTLLEQLTIGGRLIAPLGQAQQHLCLFQRISSDQWTHENLEGCRFVPLIAGTVAA